MDKVKFDAALIRKYDRSGPRYTSYPTAVQFHEGFTEADYRAWARVGNVGKRPLSLYLHIPFCDTVCYYCACNKVITRNRARSSEYLGYLYREISQQGALFGRDRPVRQLHWGGGTPTYISHQEMRNLMAALRQNFRLLDDDSGEYSIEIDPRTVDGDSLALLRELGFNRVSFGVQDLDPAVQRAVNRWQPLEQNRAAIDNARQLGFHSVSLDLIYGLPEQSVASFERTLEGILELAPDRLSVFNYAHLPRMFKPQRQIDESQLPSPEVKLQILERVMARLGEAGYVYIGMDHFALPGDELARALEAGTLQRNFQGYSTHADCDLVGLGASSIGKMGDCYNQNHKTLPEYMAAVEAGRLPIGRGVNLTFDDVLRREVIGQLICRFQLDIVGVEARYGIDFGDYFATELEQLTDMAGDGLLTVGMEGVTVLPAGRMLIRNICMVFDRYLQTTAPERFSRAI